MPDYQSPPWQASKDCRPHASKQRQENLSSLLSRPLTLRSKDGAPAQILVLKVGTSTLLDGDKQCFSLSNLGKFVDAVCDLKDRGYHVVMISSGAVGSGCIAMKRQERPVNLVEKQAVSAIGQCRLVRLWEDIFAIREKKVAQLLLTRRDLMDRPRFVNFRNTLLQLLSMDVIPIINENDALAAESLKFGDNDTLGAYVAISIGAAWFFMLTDVDCLYTANPRHHPDAKPIAYVGKIEAVYNLLDKEENDGTKWGSGGMRTKIIAAKLCCATGIHTALNHGAYPERILDVVAFAEAGARRVSDDEFDMMPRVLKSRNKADLGNKGDGASVSSKSTDGVNEGVYPINPIDKSLVDKLSRAASRNLLECPPAAAVSPTEIAGGSKNQPAASPVSTTDGNSAVARKDSDRNLSSGCCERRLAFVTFPSLDEMPYLGTIFAGQPCTQHLRDQRRWILSLPICGKIYCDENCVRAVIEKKKSLFAAGIVAIQDEFYPGEAVAMYPASALQSKSASDSENELARLIVNFSSAELERIKGRRACEFQHILGYFCAHEVAHRSNIIFVNPSPVYERYNVTVPTEAVESDTESEDEIQLGTYSPIPVPTVSGG